MADLKKPNKGMEKDDPNGAPLTPRSARSAHKAQDESALR
jgi:hypothetical protein